MSTKYKMNAKIVVSALALMSFHGSAFSDQIFAVTPSGTTEAQFPDKPQVVVGQLSGACIDRKWTIVSSGSSELVCEVPMNMTQSVLTQALIGNSYSTQPRRFIRFNVAETQGISRAQASGWVETQMAFGQIQRTNLAGPPFHNSVIDFMTAAGGKLPTGTTFPNHAWMGFTGRPIPQGKTIGVEVAELVPEQPAAVAGLQIGDIVTSIAGKKFSDTDGYLDATERAAKSPTYKIEYLRVGKKNTATLARAFRSPTSEQVVAKTSEEPTPQQLGSVTSIADELAKFAKLRDEGIVTHAEFDEQKSKLLDAK
jgi:hypothetical protein